MKQQPTVWNRMIIMTFVAVFFALWDRTAKCNDVDLELARAKFVEGIGLVEQENYQEALAAFEESYRINPKESVLFNIGMCQKALFQWSEALATFETYLNTTQDFSAERVKDAQGAIKEMQRLVGTVTLDGAPEGAKVFIDGKKVADVPQDKPVILNPGTYTLTVGMDAQENPMLILSITVGSGETKIVPFAGETSANTTPDAPKDTRASRTALFKSGWAMIGIGAAAAIAGTVTGAMALSLNGDLENSCDDSGCPPNRHSDLDKRDHLATSSTVLLASGAAVAATGIVFLVVDHYKNKKEPSPVTVSSAISPSFSGVMVNWSFQ